MALLTWLALICVALHCSVMAEALRADTPCIYISARVISKACSLLMPFSNDSRLTAPGEYQR